MAKKSKNPVPTPPPIAEGYVANFNTFKRAMKNDDVALVSAIRKEDNKPVVLVCAMQLNKDGTITPVPFAMMIDGNPYEMFHDPMA